MKSGFVTIIGRPNVGKSTLINRIVGEKLSITSNKPQTTRNKIQLIHTTQEAQIIFMDTPGIQKPKNKLGTYMLGVSRETLGEVDVITAMVDASKKIGSMDQWIFKELEGFKDKTPMILLINKIDEISKPDTLPLIDQYAKLNLFEEIIPISAINGENIGEYLSTLESFLSEGPQYFPDDMITDQPEKFIVAEFIREKALENLQEEVPHGVMVVVESMKMRENKNLMDIEATIFVERKSHKGIIIGKSGSMLKKIGSASRLDLERLLDTKINLQLWVKVSKDWREKENQVERFGYQ
ncbi:Bex protein [Urinicoccus massiliensis]|uniref:GTPase Era n=1 Tax=Urinicoccus massiliensis TaxID=1723382 RepID=A0A8H2M7H0_9FIRM|nr:GTPase Era [Urinicoccus massiliensis]VFB16206.1 Bex protein [Urinicoccus massiliensis]